ncbi:MAG TPA: hypothetical protein VGF28_13250 [Thermoanaerobaculia bacterium]
MWHSNEQVNTETMSSFESSGIDAGDVAEHGDQPPHWSTRQDDLTFGHAPLDVTDGLTIRRFDSHADLRWQWPSSCVLTRVVWRADMSPISADDPQAHHLDVSRSDYVRDGCLRIPSPGPGRWYFSLYFRLAARAVQTADAPDVVSTVARFVRPRIGYSFRRGRFRRRALTVTLESSELLTTPTIIIVAAFGRMQPLQAEDGVVIGQIDAVTLTPEVRRSFSFEISYNRRPLRFVAFFSDLWMYDDFELHSLTPAEIWTR